MKGPTGPVIFCGWWCRPGPRCTSQLPRDGPESGAFRQHQKRFCSSGSWFRCSLSSCSGCLVLLLFMMCFWLWGNELLGKGQRLQIKLYPNLSLSFGGIWGVLRSVFRVRVPNLSVFVASWPQSDGQPHASSIIRPQLFLQSWTKWPKKDSKKNTSVLEFLTPFFNLKNENSSVRIWGQWRMLVTKKDKKNNKKLPQFLRFWRLFFNLKLRTLLWGSEVSDALQR